MLTKSKNGNKKRCVICGTEFPAPPSSKKVTCSDPCRRERARRSATGRKRFWSAEKKARYAEKGQNANLKLGTAAALKSPIAGPFETNQNALIWTIHSPDGVTYTVRNLSLWLRENADKLPGTPEQARAGFAQIKRSREGKTKRSVGSWKGWTLIKWEQPK
jgi:hypothetical protein